MPNTHKKSRFGRRMLVAAATFCAVVFYAGIQYSCKKDACTYTNCLNGGSCSNGICTCAPGYTGDTCQNLATTAIVFTNDAFTPISITVNGVVQTIPVAGTATFTGTYADSANGTATTVGTGGSGGTVGETVTWTIAYAFAATTQSFALDVPYSYFFLKVADSGSKAINRLRINPLIATENAYITIPNNGATNNVGYYYAYSNTTLQGYYVDGTSYSDTSLTLPFVVNQSFTFVTH